MHVVHTREIYGLPVEQRPMPDEDCLMTHPGCLVQLLIFVHRMDQRNGLTNE